MSDLETTPHGWNIIDAQRGVLSYAYSFTAGASANCFTARLRTGGLVVVSPPAGIPQDAIDDLGAFGPVEALAPNNGFHHLGIAQWRERFPEARCFAAPKAAARIEKKSKVAGEFEPLEALHPMLGDDAAVCEACSTKCGELWVRVKLADGYAWYTSDVLANMASLPSGFVPRLLFKWTKSAPGYRVLNLAAKFILDDKKAVLRQMLQDANEHPPTVVVPAHGEILCGSDVAARTQQVLTEAIG